ncbi:MAG: TrmJ/YjtD family RNA methyltransferase [Deltaproteobacteria bacterium]|nr:TrmJ/YjtD family RNA methyltransferase [Deltaproteobacteria bacterium]
MNPVLDNIVIVLVQPERPQNIGAVARAAKNFGIPRLRLVRPVPRRLDGAYRMATHATDVLDATTTHDSLLDATADASASFAVTRRADLGDREVLTPRELGALAVKQAGGKRLALVFGPEHRGLSNEEIGQCCRTLSIPSSPSCPSLNLSHAVAVVCHEVFSAAVKRPAAPARESEPLPPSAEIEELLVRGRELLRRIGFLKEQNPNRLQPMFRSMLTRARVTSREVRVVRGILAQIEWATGKGGAQGG